MNCWEFMKCGLEEGGSREAKLGVCPAFPDYGTSCARVVGTLCNGEGQKPPAQKSKICKQCMFYNSPHYDKTDNGINIVVFDHVNPELFQPPED